MESCNIDFYCGISGETKWNQHPVAPGPLACTSPVYGKTLKRKESRVCVPECEVILDSGAFSDGPDNRLRVEQALERQIKHAHKYDYWDKVTHLASYDLLIDERWKNGERFKERWSEVDAETAVKETVDNAVWLNNNRPDKMLILSAQGVTPEQYLKCALQIIPLLKSGDVFGFGGWCITGKMKRRIMPSYAKTMRLVFPELHRQGIKQVHLWGVLLDEALAETCYWCTKYDIKLSTDSVGPSVRPAFGSWGYSDWVDKSYVRPETSTRGLERARHVQAVREWLEKFNWQKHLNPMYDQERYQT